MSPRRGSLDTLSNAFRGNESKRRTSRDMRRLAFRLLCLLVLATASLFISQRLKFEAEPKMPPSAPTFPTITPTAAPTVFLKNKKDSENEALTASRLLDPVPESPTELTMELIQQVNTDPSVLTLNPALLELFKPAPWLLPKRYPGLPYSNLSSRDLAVVAAARAKPKGKYQKAISVAFFSKGMIRMLENCVYTMVKFGGVDNYIVATWSESDLEACLDLNLPCADASAYLPKIKYSIQDRINSIRATGAAALRARASIKQEPPTTTTEGSAESPKAKYKSSQQISAVPEFESTAYNRIMWLKPAVVAYLLNQDYVVHSTDVDLSYASKPVWESYLMYLHVEPGAQSVDAAFQIEGDGKDGSPINSGNFVALPTPGTKALFSAWLALASEKIEEGGNQRGLQKLFNENRYLLCRIPQVCRKAVKNRDIKQRSLITSTLSTSSSSENSFPPPAIIRTYTPPWWNKNKDFCALSGRDRLPELDPCSPEFLYLHPVCTPKGDRVGLKTRVLDEAGFWFIDSKHGCPVQDRDLENLSEYYKKVEIEESIIKSIIISSVLKAENKKDKDDGNVSTENKIGQDRRLFTAEEERNEARSAIPHSPVIELLSESNGSPFIEQQNATVTVAPRGQEGISNQEKKKEEVDSGFDENEDLSIYSGKGIQSLERCVPLEVRRPGTEARVAKCPLRLAFV